MARSEAQQLTLAVLPKISSLFSLFGSGWIAIEVITDRAGKKLQKPYHRLLLAMSIYDILESVWNFGSTWPIPAGTENVYAPMGTTATCEAQGFFLTLSVAVPIYNALLSLYYVLCINYKVSDQSLKRWIEPSMHAIAFIWGFGTASASAGLDLFNNANLWCWIAPYPAGCKDTLRFGDEANCERGDNWWIYRWVFYFGPLWFCIFFATVCTLMVYKHVRWHDQQTLRYRRPESKSFVIRSSPENVETSDETVERSGGPTTGRDSVLSMQTNFSSAPFSLYGDQDDIDNDDDDTDRQIQQASFAFGGDRRSAFQQASASERESRRVSFMGMSQAEGRRTSGRSSIVGLVREWKSQREVYASENPRTLEVYHQALWYLATFYATHVWSTTNRIVQQVFNGNSSFYLLMFHSWFDPWQGFLNYCVYRRPKFIQIRKQNPDMGVCEALYRVMRFSYMTPLPTSDRSSLAAPRPPSRSYISENFISEIPPVISEVSEESERISSGGFVAEPMDLPRRLFRSTFSGEVVESCDGLDSDSADEVNDILNAHECKKESNEETAFIESGDGTNCEETPPCVESSTGAVASPRINKRAKPEDELPREGPPSTDEKAPDEATKEAGVTSSTFDSASDKSQDDQPKDQ